MAQRSTPDASWEDDAVLLGRDDVSDFNEDNILPLPADELAQVRAWLQPTAYEGEGSEFRKHLTAHVERTGRWLLDSPAYREWHDGEEKGLLWIRGIPGSGKSVYAATLIDAIRKENVPVLFFFFRQIIDANHQPVAALHDWLAQMLPFSPPLQVKLKKYITARRALESLSSVDLWRHLQTALRRMPKAYVIVDALDEMDRGDEMQSFLENLAELANWLPAQTKLVATSRPVAYIEATLRRAKATSIRLAEKLVDVDIATYVSYRLLSSNIEAADQGRIKEAVPGHANGIFLYAKLAMDAFLQPGVNIRDVLKTLPQDLNFMYSDLLGQHARRSGVSEQIQLLTMQFVTHATRPLRLLELANMINITQYPPEKRDLKATKNLVRIACGPLLEILPDETVSVIHHSLTEFLTGVTREATTEGYPVLEAGKTHHKLALTCLHYLQSVILNNPDLANEHGRRRTDAVSEALRQDTFMRYAGANWFIHARKAALAGADQSYLIPILDDMFTSEKLRDVMIMSNINGTFESSPGPHSKPIELTPVYAASVLGLDTYVKILLSRPGMEVNQGSNPKESPLCYASRKGYTEIVDALLKAGADTSELDTEHFSGRAPLHYAVQHNHPEIIKLLLEGGADPMILTNFNDPSALGHRDSSPFQWACTGGHVAALEAFLPFVNSEQLINQAIHWISPTGRADMLAIVLAHPLAQVNKETQKLTPLFVASGKRDALMVKALLQAGADAKRLYESPGMGRNKPGEGNNVLHAWAAFDPRISTMANNHHFYSKEYDAQATIEVFKLLIDAGADLNQFNSLHSTPLHFAQDALAARLLVEAGANVDAVNLRGETLLHLASNRATVQYLLEEAKASTNIETKMGPAILERMQTYLRGGSNKDNIELVEMFLDYGADATVVDRHGQTALHLLTKQEKSANDGDPLRVRLMRRLLDAGLDINVRNAEGQRPLHLLSFQSKPKQDDEDLLTVMVNAGVDFEARDDKGRTPLFYKLDAARHFHDDEMIAYCQQMVRLGARLDTRDSSGRSLLHAAANGSDGALIKWLVEHGLDPKIVDDDGNSLFHELMRQWPKYHYGDGARNFDYFDNLIELGIDPQRANKSGRTPLHMASTILPGAFDSQSSNVGSTTVFDWLLHKQNDVDAADEEGITALHSASTFSEYQARRLLERGADPLKATKEGLNALHLAARARQVNIVGLLLDGIITRVGLDDLSSAINGSTSHPRSPLFYACASGRPESVRLLLHAGMVVEVDSYQDSVLQGCVDFEEEVKNWPKGPANQKHDSRDVGSVTLEDKFRMAAQPGPRPSERIDEILELLAKHNRWMQKHIDEAIEEAANKNAAYTLERLLRVREQLSKDKRFDLSDATIALLNARSERRQAFGQEVTNRSLTAEEFDAAMKAHLYDVVAERMSPEDCLQVVREHYRGTIILQYLAAGGYASLLCKMASHECVAKLNDKEWVEKTQKEARVQPGDIEPLLITACRREIPNMEVLRVLVDQFNVDVNVNVGVRTSHHSFNQGRAGSSALHALVLGGHWWQVAEGIPYLVAKGADINVRDERGLSPLNALLDRLTHSKLFFSRRTVEVLLNHGADVASVDDRGVSCTDRAIRDAEIHAMLLRRVTKVSSQDLIAAIGQKNSDVLDSLLVAGADPNGRKIPSREEFESYYSFGKLKLQNEEMLPLHHVLTSFGSRDDASVQAKMVESLLKHGADPLATYEKSTMLHQVFAQQIGMPLRLLLERDIAGLDPNCIDARGVTLFHMACHYRLEKQYKKDADGEITYYRTDNKPTPAAILHSLDADIYARDNEGRNTLHHLVSASREHADFEMIRQVASSAPELINERDKSGKTPFHMAVAGLSWMGTEAVDILFEEGADATVTDNDGNTPLHMLLNMNFRVNQATNAVDSARRIVFDKLLSLPGVEINDANKAGETPIFGYMRHGAAICMGAGRAQETPENNTKWEMAVLDLFVTSGVDWLVRNTKGETLLHIAVAADNYYALARKVTRAKFLISKGVDPAAEDKGHKTALDVAASLGADNILQLFRRD